MKTTNKNMKIIFFVIAVILLIATLFYLYKYTNLFTQKNTDNTALIQENTIEIMDGDKITTMDFVANQADELLKNIAYQNEEELSKYCTQGNLTMPIDSKYSNLKNLGQLFTAIRCGNYQLKDIKDGKFISELKLNLKASPNDELLANLLNLGFSCEEDSDKNDCKTWLLKKSVDAKSLIILEPFVDFIKSDECVNCD